MMSMLMVAALAACQGRETASITGGYGSGVISGQVVMAQSGSSPAGVEVSVRGTGQSLVLAADGQFSFAALPEGAELAFRRATDSIAATYMLDQVSGHVVIELAQTTARKSGGRRRASGTGPKVEEFEGVVRSATAEQLVVFTSKQVEVTIALTPETIIRKGNTTLTAADLLLDTRVHVKAQKNDDAYRALLVIVQNQKSDDGDSSDEDSPSSREYEGLVRSVTATQLVVFDSHRREVTFLLDAQTVIRKGNATVAATDIQVGTRVHVKATVSADGLTNTATRVTIQNTNGGDDSDDDDDPKDEVKLSGAVTAVTATSLTVQSESGAVTVQTDAATRIRKRNSTITLGDVKAGDRVKVEGRTVAANTILARSIEVKSE
jgi:hypothetical protein